MATINHTRERLNALADRFGLAELYVFGSRAQEIAARVRGETPAEIAAWVRGEPPAEIAARVGGEAPLGTDPPPPPEAAPAQGPAPDVDIGVRPRAGVSLHLDAVVELTGELEALFEVGRVDLVLLPGARPFLALEVIRGELLYCFDPDDQAEYELYVLRRAGDLAPFQRARQELALSRWTEP